MNQTKPQLQPGIKEDATARNQVAPRSTASAIRFVTLKHNLCAFGSYMQYLIHEPFPFKRVVLDAPLAADAKGVRMLLVKRMVSRPFDFIFITSNFSNT